MQVRVLRLRYNGGPELTAPENAAQRVTAEFDGARNRTEIRVHAERGSGTRIVQAGLALLRMATRSGGLVPEY